MNGVHERRDGYGVHALQGARQQLDRSFSSMVTASVNPHRLGLACALESALAIGIQSASVGNKHVLMKPLIPRHEPSHEFCADTAPLILRQDEQVRIIDNQVTVRDGIA